jgi:hypothetical protein
LVREQPPHGIDIPWAHDPAQLLAILHQDQRGPQLDPEGASKRPPLAILELQVAQPGMFGQGEGDGPLCCLAVAAPVGAELHQGAPGQRVELGPLRGCGLIGVIFMHDDAPQYQEAAESG